MNIKQMCSIDGNGNASLNSPSHETNLGFIVLSSGGRDNKDLLISFISEDDLEEILSSLQDSGGKTPEEIEFLYNYGECSIYEITY